MKVPKAASIGYFGQEFHAPDISGNPPSASPGVLLDSHNRSLTTHPFLLALRDLRRQHQDDLKFAPFSNLRIRIEKNPALAEIASVTGTAQGIGT